MILMIIWSSNNRNIRKIRMKKNILINAICFHFMFTLHGGLSDGAFKMAVENRPWSWKFDSVIRRAEDLLAEHSDISDKTTGKYIDIIQFHDSGKIILCARIAPKGQSGLNYPNVELKMVNVDINIFELLIESVGPIVGRQPVYFGSAKSYGPEPFSPYLLRVNDGTGDSFSFFIAPSYVYRSKGLGQEDRFACMVFLSLSMSAGSLSHDDIADVLPFIQKPETMHLNDSEVPLLEGIRNLDEEQREAILKRIYKLQEERKR